MSFGVGKKGGANRTDRREITNLGKQGYSPQEISDRLDIKLSCILSLYQQFLKKTDEEMEDFSTVDTSTPGIAEANDEARKIISDAHAEAAQIIEDAKADPDD